MLERIAARAAVQAFMDDESLSTAAKWLNAKGYALRKEMDNWGMTRVGHFMVDTLYHILTNKSYIGVRVFRTKEERKESKTIWDAIVDEQIFARVQEKLAAN